MQPVSSGGKMRAAVYRSNGAPEVVRIEEVAKPRPKRNEVLIKIPATTVSSGDWRARSLSMPPGFGPLAPLVFGVFGPRQPILAAKQTFAFRASRAIGRHR